MSNITSLSITLNALVRAASAPFAAGWADVGDVDTSIPWSYRTGLDVRTVIDRLVSDGFAKRSECGQLYSPVTCCCDECDGVARVASALVEGEVICVVCAEIEADHVGAS